MHPVFQDVLPQLQVILVTSESMPRRKKKKKKTHKNPQSLLLLFLGNLECLINIQFMSISLELKKLKGCSYTHCIRLTSSTKNLMRKNRVKLTGGLFFFFDSSFHPSGATLLSFMSGSTKKNSLSAMNIKEKETGENRTKSFFQLEDRD